MTPVQDLLCVHFTFLLCVWGALPFLFGLHSPLSPPPPAGVSSEELTPVKNEEYSLEGSTVTLSYRYSKGSADYFFWYRQYPGKPPQFLISHLKSGDVLVSPVSGLSVTVSEDKTQMDLQISSAAVTDSAVYYCAVKPTVTGNTKTLYKNIMSKDNTILHNIH